MEPALGHLTLHSIPLFTQETAFPWQPPLAPSCPLLQPHKFCLAKKSWLWLEIMVGALIIFQQVPTGQVQWLIWKGSLWEGSTVLSRVGDLLLYSSAKAAKHRGAGRSIHSLESLTSSRNLAGQCQQVKQGQAMTGQLWAVLGDEGQQGHLYCCCHTLCTDRNHPAPHASVQQTLAWKPVWAEQTVEQHAWRHSRISAAKSVWLVSLSSITLSQGRVSCLALETEWV